MELDYAAWRALDVAHAQILCRFDKAMAETADLSCSEFEIFKHLKDAGGRLRMSRLADLVYASRSSLTRRIDRLAQRRLVIREAATEDRRGQYAVLLPAGLEIYESCAPTYGAVLSERFRAVLSDDELATLTDLLVKLGV